MQTCNCVVMTQTFRAAAAAGRCEPSEHLTCLCGGDEGRVSLAVLPVDVQVRTLGKGYDDVHVALIARDQ